MLAFPKTMLIVDDCGDIRDVLTFLLEADGWCVATAGDLQEVVCYLDNNTPEVVLLDYRLASSTADEVLDILRSKCPTAEIILMSAAADAERQAKRLNLKKCLTKPFEVQQFREVLYSE